MTPLMGNAAQRTAAVSLATQNFFIKNPPLIRVIREEVSRKGLITPPAWYYFFYCKRIMPFPWSLHPEYITRARGMQYFMLYNYGKSGWAVPTRSPTQKALRRGALFCGRQSTRTASLYSSGMVMPRISALVLLMMTVRSFGSCTGIVSGLPLPSRMSAAMSPA